MLLRKPRFVIPIFVVIMLLPSTLLAAGQDRPCLDCHKALLAKRTIHPVIAQFARMEQGCPSCHEEPHGKNKAKKSLTAAVPDLCFNCHDKGKFDKKTIHAPVAGGDCLGCHSPHASDNEALLVQPVPYLCMTCHEDKKDGRHILRSYGLRENHPVQGKRDPSRNKKELTCTSCHNPHSSAMPRLFTNDQTGTENLCLLCHLRVTVRP